MRRLSVPAALALAFVPLRASEAPPPDPAAEPAAAAAEAAPLPAELGGIEQALGGANPAALDRWYENQPARAPLAEPAPVLGAPSAPRPLPPANGPEMGSPRAVTPPSVEAASAREGPVRAAERYAELFLAGQGRRARGGALAAALSAGLPPRGAEPNPPAALGPLGLAVGVFAGPGLGPKLIAARTGAAAERSRARQAIQREARRREREGSAAAQ